MYCPQCFNVMLCPCKTCKERNPGATGVYWAWVKFAGTEVIACGACGFIPDEETETLEESGKDPISWLQGGWGGIETAQLATSKEFDELGEEVEV